MSSPKFIQPIRINSLHKMSTFSNFSKQFTDQDSTPKTGGIQKRSSGFHPGSASHIRLERAITSENISPKNSQSPSTQRKPSALCQLTDSIILLKRISGIMGVQRKDRITQVILNMCQMCGIGEDPKIDKLRQQIQEERREGMNSKIQTELLIKRQAEQIKHLRERYEYYLSDKTQ